MPLLEPEECEAALRALALVRAAYEEDEVATDAMLSTPMMETVGKLASFAKKGGLSEAEAEALFFQAGELVLDLVTLVHVMLSLNVIEHKLAQSVDAVDKVDMDTDRLDLLENLQARIRRWLAESL